MKNVYRVGDDFFVALAFVSFVIGVVLRILSFSQVPFGINYKECLFLSMMCLLFSIALNLHDANQPK
jgi:hypothetical protein